MSSATTYTTSDLTDWLQADQNSGIVFDTIARSVLGMDVPFIPKEAIMRGDKANWNEAATGHTAESYDEADQWQQVSKEVVYERKLGFDGIRVTTGYAHKAEIIAKVAGNLPLLSNEAAGAVGSIFSKIADDFYSAGSAANQMHGLRYWQASTGTVAGVAYATATTLPPYYTAPGSGAITIAMVDTLAQNVESPSYFGNRDYDFHTGTANFYTYLRLLQSSGSHRTDMRSNGSTLYDGAEAIEVHGKAFVRHPSAPASLIWALAKDPPIMRALGQGIPPICFVEYEGLRVIPVPTLNDATARQYSIFVDLVIPQPRKTIGTVYHGA